MTETNNRNDNELNNSWRAWGHHVLQSINRLESKIDSLEKELHEYDVNFSNQITSIKAKAGIIGGITGAIGSAIIAFIIAFLANAAVNSFDVEPESKDTTTKDKSIKEELPKTGKYEYNYYKPTCLEEYLKINKTRIKKRG